MAGFLLIVVWASLSLLREVTPSLYEEPLVEEGAPYNLTCSGIPNVTGWHILWENEYGNLIAKCTNSGCKSSSISKYMIEIGGDNNLTSVLSILNVTADDRGRIFTCNGYWETDKKLTNRWKLSKTFFAPFSYCKCDAHTVVGQAVNLSCEATKVHPGISCEPFQLFNGTETQLNVVMATWKRASSYQKYDSETCSGIVYPKLHGEYNFFVNVRVNIPERNLSERYYTANITIRPEVTLRILHANGTTHACPGKEKVMKCELLWWPSSIKPNIIWYLNDQLVQNNTAHESSTLAEQYYHYESSYSFIINPTHSMANLSCEVQSNLTENTTIISSSREVVSLIRPPPKPPIFAYEGSMYNNKAVVAVVKSKNVSIQCHTESLSSEVTMVCKNSSWTIQNKGNATVLLSFVFENYTTCLCDVMPESKCAISSSIIFNEVLTLNVQELTVLSLTYSISTALVLLGAIGILIAAVSYVKKRREHLHIYWSGCDRGSRSWYNMFHKCVKFKPSGADNKGSRVNKSRENAYAVVDIVNKCPSDGANTDFCDPATSRKSKDSDNCLTWEPPAPPPRQQPMKSICSSTCDTNLVQKETVNEMYGPLDDSSWTLRENRPKHDKHEGVSSSYSPPQLPPRTRPPVTEFQTLVKPLCETGNSFSLSTSRHCCIPWAEENSTETVHGNFQHSLEAPRRRAPPAPCGIRSKVMDFQRNQGSDLPHRHDVSDCHHLAHRHDASDYHDLPHRHDAADYHDLPHRHDAADYHDLPHRHDTADYHDLPHRHDAADYHDLPHRHDASHCRDLPHRHDASHCRDLREIAGSENNSHGTIANSKYSLSPDIPAHVWPPPPIRTRNKRDNKRKRNKAKTFSDNSEVSSYDACPSDKYVNTSKRSDMIVPEEVATLLLRKRDLDEGITTAAGSDQLHERKPYGQRRSFFDEDTKENGESSTYSESSNTTKNTVSYPESDSDLSMLSVVVNPEDLSCLDDDTEGGVL